MVQGGTFVAPNVFRLWGTVIVATIVMNIVGMIIMNIGFAIVHFASTNEEPQDQDYLEDERDKLINLKGTRVSYYVVTFAVLVAMLTFVLDRPPLVMFTLLIASGLVAQIAGDVYRLFRYGQGV
jgi:hypothetical protein